MSDDPFGDLDAAMGGDTDSDTEPETSAESVDDDHPDEDDTIDPREAPAFEFDETVHKALYVLDDVAVDFDDVITYDVERDLSREHGLQNIKKSELHNAALAAISAHPELVIEQVLSQRGLDDTESE
ncbi:hypothetical protein ACH9L7_19035 (plasmid) [Haloferax sp. S1W]|uniref:hypothetical protein n=1 Tax=Haloferax sp. S1W TaxID=3377110 RepID=UPI0037C7A65E